MNLLVFSGTVVRQPRFNTSGKSPVLGFTLVSSRKWGDKEFKTYCDVSVFGDRAKSLQGQFDVDDYVQVQGEAGARGYTPQGASEPKGSLTCNAMSVEVVAQSSSGRQQPKTDVPVQAKEPSPDGDDVPF